jgi:dTDP-4-amino-4,6-dideoxygalactose transaminase
VIPYGRQDIDEDDVAAVTAALRSDHLTTGPAIENFERALSRVCGGGHVAAVNSGTAALHAAYAAIGLGVGDEVVVPPLTFASTATAALQLGATVRFADVEDATLTLDPRATEEAVGPATRAVVPVDFAGHPADVETLADIAHRHGVTCVVDAAHSIGARVGKQPVGALGDVTTFSFHPVKTVTTGEGGAVVSADRGTIDRVRAFRNHGIVRGGGLRRHDEGGWHQEVQTLGLNYRMPDVLAALGTSQLRRLPAFVQRRAQLVARYRSALGDVEGLRLPTTRPNVVPAWHLFAVRVLGGRRREVYDSLRSRGIGVQVHYLPVYRHPLFADLGYTAGMCPVAEAAYEELLSLPLFPALTENQQDQVIDALRVTLDA